MTVNLDRLGRVQYQSARALEEMAAFVAVVEARGFTAAARVTQGRKATLSRRVQDLEARLGVPLLVRTTRSLRLTEEGGAYYEHARRSLASARDADAVVLSAKARPSGLLRVAASATLAAFVLDGVITAYLREYPDVRVHLETTDRKVDIVRDGFDLALRAGALADSSLVARRLGVAGGGFYASPRYLAARGEPSHPKDLAAHDVVAVPKGDGALEWPFLIGGKPKSFPIRPRLVVTDAELGARAAAAGVGIVRAPLQIVRPYLARRQLVEVLREWAPPGLTVHAVFPPGGGLVPKTRVFLDMLERWFAGVKRGRGARATA
jgi:DNA-binding transcriptional LysR family regulator